MAKTTLVSSITLASSPVLADLSGSDQLFHVIFPDMFPYFVLVLTYSATIRASIFSLLPMTHWFMSFQWRRGIPSLPISILADIHPSGYPSFRISILQDIHPKRDNHPSPSSVSTALQSTVLHCTSLHCPVTCFSSRHTWWIKTYENLIVGIEATSWASIITRKEFLDLICM